MEEKEIEYPTIHNLNIDRNDQNKYINKRLDDIINAKINKIKGYSYEKYIKNYLINVEHLECWLWKDIPKDILLDSKLVSNERYDQVINIIDKLKYSNIKDTNYYKYIININQINKINDFGIDILAKKNDNYIFIQCKNIKTSISNSALISYNKIMNRYKLNEGIVYYTNKLHVSELNNVKYIHMPFDEKYIIDEINEIKNDINTDINLYEKIKNEYIQKIYKENMNKYMNYKKNTSTSTNNNSFYSDIKWNYLLEELDNYLKINQKLPDGNNISEKVLLNFINYNEKIIDSHTEKWNEFKETYIHIFKNNTKVVNNIV
jgi:hypothetical protein